MHDLMHLPATVRVLNARTWEADIQDDETPFYVGRGKLQGTYDAGLGNPFPVAGKAQWGPFTQAAVEYTMPRLFNEDPELFEKLVAAKKAGGFEHGDAARMYRYYLRQAVSDLRLDVWPMIMHIARRVAAGEKVALICWCAPNPCHADHIKNAVEVFAQRIAEGRLK